MDLPEEDRKSFIEDSVANGYIPKSFYEDAMDVAEKLDVKKRKSYYLHKNSDIICVDCCNVLQNAKRQSPSTRCVECYKKYRMERYYENKNKIK